MMITYFVTSIVPDSYAEERRRKAVKGGCFTPGEEKAAFEALRKNPNDIYIDVTPEMLIKEELDELAQKELED